MPASSPSERWRRIEALLDGALAHEPSARGAWLDAACADDPALRREVASLLAAHERPGAADRIAAGLAPLAAAVRESGAPSSSLAGRTVGHYEVRERVGGGGMGVVHEAFDMRLGRTVALKFIQPRLSADDAAAERFRQEARTVAALEHPNICTVHEIGETEDGQLYLAMPRYAGETLEHRIASAGDAGLPVDEAIAIAAQVARGLAKAHARGIVHRDIKPSNVFVTDDGVVKVLDFGIAKLADAALTLTGAGGVPGTVAYMSPEQARGEPVDHRTDLWSLGVVLYEMLAGRRPFGGAGPAMVADAIQSVVPAPVAAHRAEVSPALDHVIATALAKQPASRHASAQDMERALLGLGTDVARGAVPGSGARVGRPGTRTVVTLASIGVLAVAAVTVWVAAARDRREASVATATVGAVVPASARGPTTIAVLPFADRSPGSDQEYFSDGITEELIVTLARVDGLRVASRTSAFAFKDSSVDVRTVGRRLGVATVLEGSVRRAGDRLRITAQLVSAADGYQLWSDTYDRDAGDAFAVQQEIARAIAQTLRVRLVGAGAQPGGAAPDAAAYDLYLKGRHALYLKGRYAWYSRTEEGLRTAARWFEQAVAQDPGYARAHAGLADAYAVLGFYDYLPPAEAFPKAEAAARRAAALDPTLAAPRATLGYVALYHHWQLERGEREFQHAIALEPNYSTAHQWYANLLSAAGRHAEAEREMQRAEELDPLSLVAKAALGWVRYHAGDHAGALEQFRRTLELSPDYALAHLWRGWALQEMDSLGAAVATHRHAVSASDSGGLFIASLARSLALAGERTEAQALLRRLEARGTQGAYVPAYEIAKVHAALGHQDAAFAWLRRAHAERAHSMVFLRVDPQVARLRADPRFASLVREVFAENEADGTDGSLSMAREKPVSRR